MHFVQKLVMERLISNAQLILLKIDELGGQASVGDIVKLGIPSHTVGLWIPRLEKVGLVETSELPSGRQGRPKKLVKLTEKGKEAVKYIACFVEFAQG